RTWEPGDIVGDINSSLLWRTDRDDGLMFLLRKISCSIASTGFSPACDAMSFFIATSPGITGALVFWGGNGLSVKHAM
ncbi:hypothetical protein, partial [Escherichia coli]|uniref:hypothetical protein n=1 Tax=Escherichia coli TaxID=562 RepID=UPI001BFC86E6